MSDKLRLAEPLAGYIVLGDGPDSEIPAVLQDTGKRIELMVPFKDIQNLPGNWFVSSWETPDGGLAIGGEIPDIMPHELLFFCGGQSYALVECRISGNTRSVGFGFGTGTIVPSYVVCGGRNNRYAEINGLRTQCLDSVGWFNSPSITFDIKQDEEKKSRSVQVCSRPIPPIVVDDGLGLVIRPDFDVITSTKTDSVTSHQSVYVETKMDVADSWEKHLVIHRAIKDLVSITDWNSREFIDMSVMRLDDPRIVGSGSVAQNRWAPVVSYYPLVKREGNENFQSNFLFTYRDIGNDGIRKWLNLRKECRQGMTLLSYLARDHRHLALETESMLVGTALECVGWYIVQSERQEKRIKKHAGKEQLSTYKDMLKAIVEKVEVGDFFKDTDLWVIKMRDVYIGNKHADACSSDFQTTYEATMQGLLILRIWLGLQLGVDAVNMKERIKKDAIGKYIVCLLA